MSMGVDQKQKSSQRRRLPGEVASVLEREIRSGRYPAGARLPTEAALATRFAVSRSAIREAMAQLRTGQLVHTYQGRGTFVADTLPRASAFTWSSIALDSAELNDIFEIRREVETGAAALAATYRTQADLLRMREAIAALERAVREDRPGTSHDLAFHQAVAIASGNRFFPEFLTFFYNRIAESITAARSNTARYSGRALLVQNEHQSIFEAIEAKEAEQARAAMRVHLSNAMRRLGLQRNKHANDD